MNRRRALSRQGSLKTHHPSSPKFMVTPELLAYLVTAAPHAPVRQERPRRPIENMIGGYVRSLRASRTTIGTTLPVPVDLSQADMGLFKAALAAHPDGAKLVPRAKDIWRSLPPNERARWHSPSVTPSPDPSFPRDIDSTGALRRTRTDPYPGPTQNGLRRSRRQTTYRNPPITGPVTSTMGYDDKLNVR
ncbi:hypothetical protein PENSPDRAFT_377602 [Peniophora sp. CONT]|nr:hypothetical protein PENSPDRAFT_377602 [Peniophora sp. CONT]